jgi:hypothetical protein
MFGLCLGAIFFATEIFVLCGVIAGALTGAVFPEVSSLILIGAVRFFFGIFSLSILRLPKNLKKSPLGRVFHVKATFLFGISYAILAAICFYL